MFTRTANLLIGFRRLTFSDWQKNPASLIAWAKENHFSLIDLARDADTSAQPFLDAGLSIGSADLPEWNALVSPNPDTRKAAVDKNAAYIDTCSKLGIHNYFIVMLPENPALPRQENFAYMVESLNALSPAFEAAKSHLVMEGWPGPGALCCTPESVRATFKACPSPRIGFNFDPSHLLRVNIDPLRFLREFAHRVYHVHGKDTELFPETIYECGSEQPSIWTKPHGFGSLTWRYTIPGHGAFRWTRALQILSGHNYQGAISIELEDENFNGSEPGEKQGLLASAQYLQNC